MKKVNTVIWAMILLLGAMPLTGQNLYQIIKGKVSDKESQAPLIGANVFVEGLNQTIGAATDANGEFKLTGVPVGRHTITVSYMGYIKTSIPEVLVGSGKEVVLNIDLKEELSNLNEVVITARKNKGDVKNTMATVSARSFNVEETSRYAGGLDDPARLASAFAGVSTTGSVESNAIIVRGNSPTGVMWQVEGVEVPIPSHFSNSDVMGGGAITLFSNNILSNSDFFTGAFPAEYGNASAGVFDVHLRTGNNEKREHSFSIGVLGIDASSEGPFKKGGKASYLFNYRYSTYGLVQSFLPQQGLPVYQDLCFKLNFPTEKAGTFSLWGIGGIDNYVNKATEDSTKWTDNHARLDLNSKFYPGSGGIGHKIVLGNNTYIQSTAAASSYSRSDDTKWVGTDKVHYPFGKSTYSEYKYTLRTFINHKFNSRLTNRTGLIANMFSYDYNSKRALQNGDTISALQGLSTRKGSSYSYQFYSQFKYDVSQKLSLNAGIHSMLFALNNKASLEPRLGIKYSISKRHGLSFAYGMHSQMQMLSTYFIEKEENGKVTLPNKDLDFTRAQHFVLGYDFLINENMRLKVEPYYQRLSKVPVEANSSFSLINIQEGNMFDKALVSKGSGTNYGVDITVERFLKDGFYYLATASLFQSKYKGGDGVERNTIYNGHYVLNLLGGKEWNIGKAGRNNLLGISTRLYLKGGNRQRPVDVMASQAKRDVVYDETRAFEDQDPMLYRLDLSMTYRINRAGLSHIFTLQLNNALASPSVYQKIYDYTAKNVKEEIKGDPFPSISWKVEF